MVVVLVVVAGPDDDPLKVGVVTAIYVTVERGSNCGLSNCGEGQVNQHV